MITAYLLEKDDRAKEDSFISPVCMDKKTLAKFPLTYILTCDKDPLRDSAILFGYFLNQQNVKVIIEDYEEMLHGCLNLSINILNKEANKFVERNLKIIREIFKN